MAGKVLKRCGPQKFAGEECKRFRAITEALSRLESAALVKSTRSYGILFKNEVTLPDTADLLAVRDLEPALDAFVQKFGSLQDREIHRELVAARAFKEELLAVMMASPLVPTEPTPANRAEVTPTTSAAH